MTHMRKLVRAEITALGDREVQVVMSTAALARDGHILAPGGCVLDNYRANPIVLWSHDPDKPIGNVDEIVVGPDQITARVAFAPAGLSHKADEICGLTKASVIRAVSVGFDPIDMEPLDPKKPRGGQRISAWDLLEMSFVSVGADVGALVTARQHRDNGEETMSDWKVGAKHGLPIEDSDDWDGGAAGESIFEWAGGDDFDPAKARQGFLVYDASADKERGSYKLPIAHEVAGELKVPKGAIRAAASRLPQTDIPDDVKADAQKVLDAYREEAGIGEENRSARKTMRRKAKTVRRVGKIKLERGMYAVADLCWLFECLGWQVEMAKFEADIEGDESKVPAMLAGVFHDLGEVLLAMTAEEIAEALAGCDVEPEDIEEGDEILVVEDRAHIAAATSPLVRALRRGLAHAKLRSGKTLSADTVQVLREAKAQHEEAIALHRSAIGKHKDAMGAVDDMMDRAGVSDDDEDDDEDTTDVQTSNGTGDSGGSENDRGLSADFRRRQAEALALVA